MEVKSASGGGLRICGRHEFAMIMRWDKMVIYIACWNLRQCYCCDDGCISNF
jgi:hypothetical protein